MGPEEYYWLGLNCWKMGMINMNHVTFIAACNPAEKIAQHVDTQLNRTSPSVPSNCKLFTSLSVTDVYVGILSLDTTLCEGKEY